MGCNCGGKTRPMGSTVQQPGTVRGGGTTGDSGQSTAATTSTESQIESRQTQDFTLVSGGRVQSFGSRLERDAAARRQGLR